MAIYYLTIGALTGLGCALTEKQKGTKRTILYLTVSFLILALLASLRYAIGFDYFSYRDIYDMVCERSVGDILHSYWYEPLFFAVCKFFCLIGCPYQCFLLCINLFVLGSAMWFIYHHSSIPWVSVYLYLTLQFLAYDMNLVRQSIAVSFLLLAYPYLRDRKVLPFTALILTGGLFHNSLLFMLPLYFLLPKKWSRKGLFGLLALTAAAYAMCDQILNFLQPILPEKYAKYFGSYFWNANTFVYVVFPALYALLIFLFRSRITDMGQRQIYLNSSLCYCLISLFITRHFILERFAIYPFAFSLIAIPEIIASFDSEGATDERPRSSFGSESAADERPRSYYAVLGLFLLISGGYFLFAAAKGFHNVYPYVSLFDKSCSS